MLIRLLPLLAAVAPILAVFLAYWLGVTNGALPSCNPFLDGCVSISATGRHAPGSFVFKAIQLPFAVVSLIIWYFSRAWLGELASDARTRRLNGMFASGLFASLALIIYVTFLGTTEPAYEFMRRFGIYAYFLGTAIAQLILSRVLLQHATAVRDETLRRLATLMLALVALPFLLGLVNLVLKNTLDDANAAENQIEWIASLCMQAWLLLLYNAWRTTGFSVSVTTR